jgi:hypothetical protein
MRLVKAALIFIFATTTWACADLRSDPPTKIVACLASFGIPTKAWAPNAGEPGRYFVVAVPDEQARNIKLNQFMFVANGTQRSVESVELHLAIKSPGDAASAEATLAKAASALCVAAKARRGISPGGTTEKAPQPDPEQSPK